MSARDDRACRRRGTRTGFGSSWTTLRYAVDGASPVAGTDGEGGTAVIEGSLRLVERNERRFSTVWHRVEMSRTFPVLRAVVLDAVDARGLAEFYRELLGYQYRPGDESPPAGQPDPHGQDWLVLRDRTGDARLAVQRVAELPMPTWPDPRVPQQLHLDLTVADVDDLSVQRDRALALGAKVLLDRSADPGEPLYVFADPEGHPFCIFVSPDHPD